ncbi:hypothetical protein niasHT_011800 [Heterodera trifolii]|uniref:Uncharacterized protein n=1 Tax=Heterodera trifolii TaxID=157864 RepID=A0ABD2L566_9BILA
MFFNPPWVTKIGQLQQVTRTIRRNSDAVLDNRGAVIVRCYPYRSATYMHLVYNLIYSTLASNTQFGSDQTPDEIRPILLNYSGSAKQSLSNPSVILSSVPQSAAAAPFAGGVFHLGGGTGGGQLPQQHQWTDCVLIRVHFRNHECALFFMQLFNRSVFRVFDRRQVRAPFCHADLTRPERVLRNYLQQMCDEKNSAANRLPPHHSQQQYHQGRLLNVAPRYYHNGFHLYREFPNGRVELVPWEQFSMGQYLHVIVASLRKYAALYKQKQCYVIIQNVAEHNGSAEEDTERITSIVYSVVSSDGFRQRCNQTKQKLDLLKNSAVATNADGQPIVVASGHLPLRIERLPRRGTGSSASRSATTVTTARGEGQQQQTTTMTAGAEKQWGEGKTADGAVGGEQKEYDWSNAMGSSRPALIRVHFRNREAAIAFCQLFRERQIFLRQKRQQQPKEQDDEGIVRQHGTGIDCVERETDAGNEEEKEEGDGQQTDSYSDLSDLDVFSSCDEDTNGGHEKTPPVTREETATNEHGKKEGGETETEESVGEEGQQQKTESKAKATEEGKTEEGDTNNNTKAGNSGMKRKKMQSPASQRHRHGHCSERRQQHKQHLLDSLICGAFAHRDLTPPELALGYALRQHCREQNRVPNARVFLYPRAGRIFERIAAAEAK